MKIYTLVSTIVAGIIFSACTSGTPFSGDPTHGPKITIASPTEEQTFETSDSPLLQLEDDNFDNDQGKVKLIVDEKSAITMEPEGNLTYKIPILQEGSHILRAYLVDHNGIALETPGSYTYRNFNVGEDSNLYTLLPTEPIITTVIPEDGGTYPAGKIPIDVILDQAGYGKDGYFVKFWYRRAEEDESKEIVGRIKSTEPTEIELAPGEWTIRFQLFTWGGDTVDGNWTWDTANFTVE